MLTESQAWKYLAKVWKNVQEDGRSKVYTTDEFRRSYGLCYSIVMMSINHLISEEAAKKLIHKTQSLSAPPGLEGYKWPLTASGAKKRVAFCLKMAKRTKRKKHANPRSR